jgi:hypothetical protein
MRFNKLSAVAWITASILIVSACSRSENHATSKSMSVAEQSEIAKRYDPFSLIEVRSISDLPKGLKFHLNRWLGQRNEKIGPPSEDDDPGDRPGRFIIAGVSDKVHWLHTRCMDMLLLRMRRRMCMRNPTGWSQKSGTPLGIRRL